MRFASAFSGIEAASSAWHPLGWETAVVIEFDAFPSAVLAHHYPDVPNLGDITQVTEDQIKALGQLDVFVFGSPCQDLSVAGKRKGLEGERSGLFFDAMRLVRWMRQHCGLRWAVWENVPGAFSSNNGRDFAAVVAALGGLDTVDVPPKGWGTEGVVAGPEALVEWSTLDAQWFGVAQRRRRCFAVADFGAWAGRPPVLLEPDRLRGDSAPSREAREDAPTIPSRSTAGGGLGTDFDCDGGVIAMAHGQGGAEIGFDRGPTLTCNHEAPIAAYPAVQVCPTLRAGGNRTGDDRPPGTDVDTADSLIPVAVTHTLRGEGFDASEDGTGRGTPLVPVGGVKYAHYSHDYAHDRITDVAGVNPALTKEAHASGNLNVAVPVGVIAQNGSDVQAGFLHTVGTIGASQAKGTSGDVIAFDSRQDPVSSEKVFGALGSSSPQAQAVAWGLSPDTFDRSGEAATGTAADRSGLGVDVELAYALRAKRAGGVATAMQVRRLTPRECERLQGFHDDYTAIPWRKKTADQCPDGPRYKALGNSMAVPVMRWIGQRIEFAHLYF